MDNLSLKSETNIFSSAYGFQGVDYKLIDSLPEADREKYIKEAFGCLQQITSEWLQNNDGKTVGLAKMALGWMAKATPKAKYKLLESEIQNINRSIEKRKKAGMSYDSLVKELESLETQRVALLKKFPDISK